jgi:hypothetical protein
LVGDHIPKNRTEVFDRIGPERPRSARDGNVQLARVDQKLHAVARLESLEPPDPVQVFVLLLLRDDRERAETGGCRERKKGRGEASGGNAVLRR